jgi:hypothetical protein
MTYDYHIAHAWTAAQLTADLQAKFDQYDFKGATADPADATLAHVKFAATLPPAAKTKLDAYMAAY